MGVPLGSFQRRSLSLNIHHPSSAHRMHSLSYACAPSCYAPACHPPNSSCEEACAGSVCQDWRARIPATMQGNSFCTPYTLYLDLPRRSGSWSHLWVHVRAACPARTARLARAATRRKWRTTARRALRRWRTCWSPTSCRSTPPMTVWSPLVGVSQLQSLLLI